MSLVMIVLTAIGLAMDAFAVSVAIGIALGRVSGGQTARLAAHFGLFQFMMPIIGWLAGSAVAVYLGSFDHWLAMGLLWIIGGNMMLDAIRGESSVFTGDPTRGMTALLLAIATSIDALAVGLGLGMLETGIVFPSIVIGLVAAAFTVLGLRLGCRVGMRFSRGADVLGGLILIAIGLKIVLDHTGYW